MTTELKPHKGSLANWWKQHFDRAETESFYGENSGLGFIIRGTFINHPRFGYSSGSSTSWVISMGEPDEKGDREIETRNSRYTLIGPSVKPEDNQP